jgi:DNA invertase Pin-like site-specific DNA recombinase
VQLDGYIRVSQVRGRKGESFISPKVQREEIGRWISSSGAGVGVIFEELNQSGGRADRPLLTEAVERVESGLSDGIVVYKLHRFGRSLFDGLSLIARIQAAGGNLVSVKQNFNLRTSTGQLVTSILFAVAEWELDEQREYWDLARAKAVERGIYICRKGPIGYRRGEDRRLHLDPREAPVIREVFERRLAGESSQQIAEFLNDSEIETESGAQFNAERVYKIIKNPAYCGVTHSGRYRNPNAHEPIVDAATWQACQFTPRPPGKWVESLVSGMIRCASCGSMMTSLRTAGAKTKANTYRCCASRYTAQCSAPAQARGDELDPLVEEFIFRHSQRGRPVGGDRETEEREAAVAAAEADLVAYRDNIGLQRTLGTDSFEAGLAKRVSVVERKLLELARVKRGRNAPRFDPERLEQEWPQRSWEQRRKIARGLFECIVVERGSTPVIERAWIFKKGQGPLISGPRKRICFSPPPGDQARLKEHEPWDEERIERELSAFFADREPIWPKYLDFAKAGYGRLHAQVSRSGGPYRWAGRVSFEVPQSSVRWDQRAVQWALAPFLAGKTEWPRKSEFVEAGLIAVYAAVKRNGGLEYWAQRFELPYKPVSGPRPRWPKERVESELGQFLSGRDAFPTKNEFDRAGQSRLWGALVSHGGAAHWAERFSLPAPGRIERRPERWPKPRTRRAKPATLAERPGSAAAAER